MSVTNRLRKLVYESSETPSKNAELRALEAFYEAAKRDGIVKAPEYDLPQLDTIGRRIRPVD